MKAHEKWDLGVELGIHKRRMGNRNTKSFEF
jgi:hypothetical protein